MPEEYKPVEISGNLRPELKEALGRLNAELATKYQSAANRESREAYAQKKEGERKFTVFEAENTTREKVAEHRQRQNYGKETLGKAKSAANKEGAKPSRPVNDKPQHAPENRLVKKSVRSRGLSQRLRPR